ncbi:MAG: hypothetical protein PVF74_08150 [Anaerolineales bacterium]
MDFSKLYERFHKPITHLNCGDKCAPYNEHGVPFCCDTDHAIPTAYLTEWDYLTQNTDLWHLWSPNEMIQDANLRAVTPDDQVLIECLGHISCQRDYRSITCRAFPFYPYITEKDEFIGISYYWEYEDRCWVISNLSKVQNEYRFEFIRAYDELFNRYPHELDNFKYQSSLMRHNFQIQRRTISLLHRNNRVYKISPKTGRMRRVSIDSLPKFGVYKIASEMRFSDE